ncbi:MAG: transposase [Nitrososphaeria archaeon]
MDLIGLNILVTTMYKPMGSKRSVVRKLYKLSSKLLTKGLGIKVGKNSKYKPDDTVKLLIYISLNRTSAESGSNDLAEDMDVPSADVILKRLKSLDLGSVINSLNEINMKVVKKHMRDGMKMAIDYTEEPYYGKIDMYVTRGKYKQGTDRFHTFATISVVGKDERERLTLYSLPVTRLDAKEEIVKKLIENSPKPSLLLMDRGFFTVEVIKLLDEMDIKFIIPAVMNKRVKRVVDDYIHGRVPAVIEYEMGAKIYMVIAKKQKKMSRL